MKSTADCEHKCRPLAVNIIMAETCTIPKRARFPSTTCQIPCLFHGYKTIVHDIWLH